jgi:hypothetical protein
VGDYRQAAKVSILENPLICISQAYILDQLGICNGKMLELTEYTKSPLTNLTSWQYFRLLDAFRYILCPLYPDHPFLQTNLYLRAPLSTKLNGSASLSLDEWLVFIATFHYVFESWPDNFMMLLDGIPQARGHISMRGIIGRLGTIYRQWMYRRLGDASFSFLREAFSDYLKRRYAAGSINQRFIAFQDSGEDFVQHCRYVTIEQAAKMLGTYGGQIKDDGNGNGVHKLIINGDIRAKKISLGKTGKKSVYLVEKADVEALLKQWSELLPLKTVQESFLGINRANMRSLAKARLLIPIQMNSNVLLYKRSDVEQFIAIVMQYVQTRTCNSLETVSLTYFRPSITWKMEDTFRAIHNGSLRLIDTEAQQPLFQRLVLTREEVDRFLDRKVQERQQNQRLFTIYEVASKLEVNISLVLRWIKDGYIKAETLAIDKGHFSWRISQESFEIFRTTYVSSEGAAELLGVTRQEIKKFIQRGELHSIRGHCKKHLFLRSEVEALKVYSESCAVKEAAKLLHLTEK